MKFTDLDGKTISEIKDKQGKVIFAYERKIEVGTMEPLHFHEAVFNKIKSEGIIVDGWGFYNCDFSFCDFYGLHCDSAKFINCNLSNSNFRGGQFYDVVFDGSIINECDFGLNELGGSTGFQNCDFEKAKILNCNFEAIKYDVKTKWPKEFRLEEMIKVKKEVSCP